MDLVEKYLGEQKEISYKEAMNMLKKGNINVEKEAKQDGFDVYSAKVKGTKHYFIFSKNNTIQKKFIDDALNPKF